MVLLAGCTAAPAADTRPGAATQRDLAPTTSTPTTSSTVAPGTAASSATSAPPDVPTAAASASSAFHCFGWIHGPDFSDDCYRSASACADAAGEAQQGARPTRPCRPVATAYCTDVSRPPDTPTAFERCFERAIECERYRSFVGRTAHVTTACAAR